MDPTHLKSIPLFAEVPDDELAKIATFAQEVTVEEGRELVREGDFSYEFMAIEEGEAEVTRHGEHVADLAPGDFFGEMGLLEKTLAQRDRHRQDADAARDAHRMGPQAHRTERSRGNRARARDARGTPAGELTRWPGAQSSSARPGTRGG